MPVHICCLSHPPECSVERTTVSRQPAPYKSDCHSDWIPPENVETPVPTLKPETAASIPYDSALCQSFCLDSLVHERCNCSILALMELDRGFTEPCGTWGENKTECAKTVIEDQEAIASLDARCVSPA